MSANEINLTFPFLCVQRSIRPQVVTTFELPGCQDMWTVIGPERKKEKLSEDEEEEEEEEETKQEKKAGEEVSLNSGNIHLKRFISFDN